MSRSLTSQSFAGSYRFLWAKSSPRHPLWKHVLDASAVSLALPSPLITFGWQAEETALLVGLHDVGKADSFFQHQLPEFSDELERSGFLKTGDAKCRHERLSAAFIRNALGELDPYVTDAIARALVAHHGHFDETPRPVAKAYADAQSQLYQMLRDILGVEVLPTGPPSNLSAFGIRLAGHLVLCDWIASNEDFLTDSRLSGVDNPPDYFQAACSVAADWVSNLGFDRLGRAGSLTA